MSEAPLKRNIELGHNAISLPHRARVKVLNARLAEKYLCDFVDSRIARGMRLRIVPDYNADIIEIGARSEGMYLAGLRALKDCGRFVKILPWELNHLLRSK